MFAVVTTLLGFASPAPAQAPGYPCTDAGIYGPLRRRHVAGGPQLRGRRLRQTGARHGLLFGGSHGGRLRIESVFALAECKPNAAHRRPMRSGNPLFTAR